MRVLYQSTKGGKPLRIGMNYAKRVARSADQRDQLAVQRELGPGLPRQHSHHQQLVKQRHAYYADAYEEAQRVIIQSAAASTNDQGAGDAGGAVPEPAPGPDPGERDPVAG